jgi:hypothetical protein
LVKARPEGISRDKRHCEGKGRWQEQDRLDTERSGEEQVQVVVEKYESCADVVFSDHKPVVGCFLVAI